MTIALVTPLKDEIEHLPRLYSSVAALTVEIAHWIICENGSTDGSIGFLASAKKPHNVRNLHILHIDTGSPEYQLGFKYSRIVEAGFNHLTECEDFPAVGFVGILDADCFPYPNYYERLLMEFEARPRLGIVSGSLVRSDGTRLPAGKGFPRGNSRLWRKSCFEEAPYIVGMSADTLSAIRAEVRGWQCDALNDAFVETRDVGHRAGQRYYGESAYYRGETLPFTLMKCLRRSSQDPVAAVSYLQGYVRARSRRAPQVEDWEILNYSRAKLSRYLRLRR